MKGLRGLTFVAADRDLWALVPGAVAAGALCVLTMAEGFARL
jgi:hypothetical protein